MPWFRAFQFFRELGRLSRDQAGNVAITFCFATLPLIGFVGTAVDYSRANAAKAAFQAALDSTALMISKEASSDTTDQLQTNTSKYFLALFNRSDVKDIKLTTTYTTTGGTQVLIDATAKYPTTFMNVIGYDHFPFSLSSTVKWGYSRLRVALVLDNTGSMASSGKMAALKTATKNLLDQLNAAASTNGDVYVSIVPFVKDINADSSNYNASWIDWTDWDKNNVVCNKKGNKCKPAAHKTWNGCITDRGNTNTPTGQNYDTNVDPPINNNKQSLYPAEQYGSCPQAVMGLSYDWPGMKMLVDNMSPSGNTNQAIGLAWGWLSLEGGGPFTVPAMDPNYTYQKIIILLTDGLNTEDRWYNDQAAIDARQTMTCDNVKAAKVTLYTIQVNTGGDPTSSLLQKCASDSSKFFLLTSANEIVTTFDAIGTDLTKLFVAK